MKMVKMFFWTVVYVVISVQGYGMLVKNCDLSGQFKLKFLTKVNSNGGGGCSPQKNQKKNQKKPSQFTNFGVATGFFWFFFWVFLVFFFWFFWFFFGFFWFFLG